MCGQYAVLPTLIFDKIMLHTLKGIILWPNILTKHWMHLESVVTQDECIKKKSLIRWSTQRLNKAEEWKRETAHNETERKLNLWDHKELEIFHGYSVCLFFVQRVVQVLLLRCLLLSLPHQKKVYYGFWTHNCWWQFAVRSDHPKSFSTSIYNWKGNRTQAKCVYTIKHVTCNCRTFFCTINFQDFWGSNFHQIYFRTLAL